MFGEEKWSGKDGDFVNANDLNLGAEAEQYPGAIDGDIYLNPFFGDLWVVDSRTFIKINDGYTIDIEEPEGFVKVGHIDGVIHRKHDPMAAAEESLGVDTPKQSTPCDFCRYNPPSSMGGKPCSMCPACAV